MELLQTKIIPRRTKTIKIVTLIIWLLPIITTIILIHWMSREKIEKFTKISLNSFMILLSKKSILFHSNNSKIHSKALINTHLLPQKQFTTLSDTFLQFINDSSKLSSFRTKKEIPLRLKRKILTILKIPNRLYTLNFWQ